MDRVVAYEQVQNFVGDIRNLRQGFVTNFFWDERKHPYWMENRSLFFLKADHCYLLLHRNGQFSNLFYIATDMGAVAEALGQTTLETDSVIDIVSKQEGQEETEVLRGAGFRPYRQLFRMSHIGQLADDSWEEPEGVTFGEDADVQQVYDTLQTGFDPLSEQLPSMQEVRDFVQRRQLLVVREGESLCGFLIFELSGRTSWYLQEPEGRGTAPEGCTSEGQGHPAPTTLGGLGQRECHQALRALWLQKRTDYQPCND